MFGTHKNAALKQSNGNLIIFRKVERIFQIELYVCEKRKCLKWVFARLYSTRRKNKKKKWIESTRRYIHWSLVYKLKYLFARRKSFYAKIWTSFFLVRVSFPFSFVKESVSGVFLCVKEREWASRNKASDYFSCCCDEQNFCAHSLSRFGFVRISVEHETGITSPESLIATINIHKTIKFHQYNIIFYEVTFFSVFTFHIRKFVHFFFSFVSSFSPSTALFLVVFAGLVKFSCLAKLEFRFFRLITYFFAIWQLLVKRKKYPKWSERKTRENCKKLREQKTLIKSISSMNIYIFLRTCGGCNVNIIKLHREKHALTLSLSVWQERFAIKKYYTVSVVFKAARDDRR